MNKKKVFLRTDYLHDKEVIREFLKAALENSDPDFFIESLAEVAKARGMARLAREAGLGEECLRQALAEGSKPSFDMIQKITNALGVPLTVKADALAAAEPVL